MPVIGTPASGDQFACCDPAVSLPSPAAVSCAAQGVVAPPISTVHKQPLPTRLQAVLITAGQQCVIQWTMRDRDGNPIDLTACGCGDGSSSSASAGTCPTIRLRWRESARGLDCRTREGVVVNGAIGLVSFALTAEDTQIPGMYFAEAECVDATAETPILFFSNMFYLTIGRGMSATSQLGPPTMAEIRLQLRDSSPLENFLIDTFKFDDAEIAAAIGRPIEYWNEVPPPVRRYTTQNFPFRYHWLEAIIGNLFLMTAEHQRANTLEYQAGGISVNDMSKERNYEIAGQTRWQAWKDFVRAKKAEINLAGCYGGIGSPYGR